MNYATIRGMGVRSLASIVDFVDAPAGTWYILPESHMHFSETREQHPWILVREWGARTAFGHGCVRTSQPGDDGIRHPRHQAGHESMCYLDWNGRVLPDSYRQIPREARNAERAYRSCCEDEASGLLEQLLRKVPAS
jgi:hypothetical protein